MDCRKQFLAQSLLAQSGIEKQALIKNFIEDLKLQKVLTHIETQEQIYRQLFNKEKQVVEYRQSRLHVDRRTMFSSVPEMSVGRMNRERPVRLPTVTTIYVEEAPSSTPKMSRSCSMPEAPLKADSRSGSAKTSEETLHEAEDSTDGETADHGDVEEGDSSNHSESEGRIKESLLGNMKPHFMVTKRSRISTENKARIRPQQTDNEIKRTSSEAGLFRSEKSNSASGREIVLGSVETFALPPAPVDESHLDSSEHDARHSSKQRPTKSATKQRGVSAQPVFYLTTSEADVGDTSTDPKEGKASQNGMKSRNSFCEGSLHPGVLQDDGPDSRRPSANLRRSQTMYQSTTSALRRDLKEMKAARVQKLNKRFDLQKALSKEKDKFRLLAHRVDEFLKRLQKSTKR